MDVGVIGEVEFVHLLDDAGEGDATAAVVPHILKDALEALGHSIITEAFLGIGAGEFFPQRTIDEGEHVIGAVGIFRPGGPCKFFGEAALE